jgi:hypothetical protein
LTELGATGSWERTGLELRNRSSMPPFRSLRLWVLEGSSGEMLVACLSPSCLPSSTRLEILLTEVCSRIHPTSLSWRRTPKADWFICIMFTQIDGFEWVCSTHCSSLTLFRQFLVPLSHIGMGGSGEWSVMVNPIRAECLQMVQPMTSSARLP